MIDSRPHVRLAAPSPMLNLVSAGTLYGLDARVVGIESLRFVHHTFDALRTWLSGTVDRASSAALKDFYATVDCLDELCAAMYRAIGGRLVNLEAAHIAAASAKWDLSVVPQSPSPYVSAVLSELRETAARLSHASSPCLTTAVRSAVWQGVAGAVLDFMLDTFAAAKKCTTEGRSQMQVDLSAVSSNVRKLTGLNPLPTEAHVQEYINAFYLQNDDEIVAWVQEHADYSPKHLTALVNASPALTRKGRGRAQEIIDARDPNRKKGGMVSAAAAFIPRLSTFGLGRS